MELVEFTRLCFGHNLFLTHSFRPSLNSLLSKLFTPLKLTAMFIIFCSTDLFSCENIIFFFFVFFSWILNSWYYTSQFPLSTSYYPYHWVYPWYWFLNSRLKCMFFIIINCCVVIYFWFRQYKKYSLFRKKR